MIQQHIYQNFVKCIKRGRQTIRKVMGGGGEGGGSGGVDKTIANLRNCKGKQKRSLIRKEESKQMQANASKCKQMQTRPLRPRYLFFCHLFF